MSFYCGIYNNLALEKVEIVIVVALLAAAHEDQIITYMDECEQGTGTDKNMYPAKGRRKNGC